VTASWGDRVRLLDQTIVAVNISPLVETAAMSGSTISAMLRMVFLLLLLREPGASRLRSCNISD
jgi:hypothetical protein